MLLGVYWSFRFPTNLYSFEYFTYKGTVGGHGHSPSELSIICQTENFDEILEALDQLIDQHQDGRIFIWRDDIFIKIVIGAYELFDYDFCLAKEVEKILQTKNIAIVDHVFDFKDSKNLIRLIGPGRPLTDKRSNIIFKAVGSSFSQYDNQLLLLRYDCNVLKSQCSKYISEVNLIAQDERINLAFYNEKIVKRRNNLMMFFGFGRQGVNLAPLIRINEKQLEERIYELQNKYSVGQGHYRINEADHLDKYYPEYKIRKDMLIVDEDFIP